VEIEGVSWAPFSLPRKVFSPPPCSAAACDPARSEIPTAASARRLQVLPKRFIRHLLSG
jgi:hypothetical protein